MNAISGPFRERDRLPEVQRVSVEIDVISRPVDDHLEVRGWIIAGKEVGALEVEPFLDTHVDASLFARLQLVAELEASSGPEIWEGCVNGCVVESRLEDLAGLNIVVVFSRPLRRLTGAIDERYAIVVNFRRPPNSATLMSNFTPVL